MTAQFTSRSVRKTYVLLTDRGTKSREFVVRSKIARIGDRYASTAAGEPAETRFSICAIQPAAPNIPRSESAAVPQTAAIVQLNAFPVTGRTHQIRVHAADRGLPILGDVLYGGTAFDRICLHAAAIEFRHPATNEWVTFESAPDFGMDPRRALRAALIDSSETNAFRVIHGASDSSPGLYVDQLGDVVLTQ